MVVTDHHNPLIYSSNAPIHRW